MNRPHHRPDGRYQNPWPGSALPRAGGFFKWWMDRRIQGVPRDPHPSVFQRLDPTFASPRASAEALTATWIGHAAVLLQIGGMNVLTDPMFGQRASPVRFAGPRRWVAPGVALDALPQIDLILLSHNHYDHLDLGSVRRLGLPHRPPPLAPARSPPQAEIDFDQASGFDPTEVEPVPDFDFDQSTPEIWDF